MRIPWIVVPALIFGGVLSASEWVHWRAATRRLGSPAVPAGREAILVLGCRNRGDRANLLNRHRVRIAVRSIDPRATESVLVFCGGAVGGDVPEADLLQRHACEVLGYDGPCMRDRLSRSTWENVANTTDLLGHFDTIKIASNSLHAEKARAYLWKQRPDLARRLTSAKDHRVGEIVLVKPVLALLGLWNLHRIPS